MKYSPRIFFILIIWFTSCNNENQSTAEKQALLNIRESFQQAILENDKEIASEILSENVEILEYGIIEKKEDYLGEHFFYDGRFLQSMENVIEEQTVRIKSDVAWISTKSRMTGTYNSTEHDLNFLELLVLERLEGSWKISSLHWSSSERNQ